MNSSTHDECCSDVKCESGLRNNYFEGKRLTAESFRIEQEYMLKRRRQLNRAVHGWGVVNGYKVKALDSGELRIGAGLALDELGRELLNSKTIVRPTDLFDERGDPFDPATLPEKPEPGECWLLTAHYAEEKVELVKVKDPCHECECDEWNHICETVRFTLRRQDCDKCCVNFPCELECGCGGGDCCGGPTGDVVPTPVAEPGYEQNPQVEETQPYQTRRSDTPDERAEKPPLVGPLKRGGCRCMCDHLRKLKFPSRSKLPRKIDDPCGRNIRFDHRNGVSLACVHLEEDEGGCWRFTKVEPCGPRRLIKSNDLLFDLIRGCDLTRIVEVGWQDLLGADPEHPEDPEDVMTYENFSDAFGSQGNPGEYVSTKFFIRFSRAVRAETLRPSGFVMTAIYREYEGGWRHISRVPIIKVDTSDFVHPDDPQGHVRGARIVVKGSWINDALRGSECLFYRQRIRIEFEVRGDLIVDCNGQAIDANSVGYYLPPTGNGTPGGTFLSTFRVKRRPRGDEVDFD